MGFVLIPEGPFYMGDDDYFNEYSELYDEGPEHEVNIEKAFYLGTKEGPRGNGLR
jgi:formylglycine-generating enzyme required for sulfatase activity